MEVLAFVIGVVLMIVGLAVSIALHELGHLWPAKKFGVRVGQYMIGFGPTLWSKRIGETQYGFKAIPLGGYISMAGMYAPSAALRQAQGPGGAAEGPGSSASGHRSGLAGGGFFATMVQDARAANDETLVSDDDDRVFYKLPVWQRIVIMLGGPVMNLLFAIVLFAILLTGIGIQSATTTVSSVSECIIPTGSDRTTCEASDPAAPAAAAGMQPGDTIVAIDGEPVDTFADAAELIQASPGQSIAMTVERDGETQTLTVTPVGVEQAVTDEQGNPVLDENGDPQLQEVGIAGIRGEVAYLREPIWVGPQLAFERVGAVAGIIWQLPVKVWETGVTLVTGEDRDPNGPLSIVGAGVLAGEVAAAEAPVLNRVAGFLELLAALNIALFVFNLIPLLPLDGGHIAIALWDGIKRVWAKVFNRRPPKPVDATKLVPVTFVVVIALISMGAVLILADIVNPVSLFGP